MTATLWICFYEAQLWLAHLGLFQMLKLIPGCFSLSTLALLGVLWGKVGRGKESTSGLCLKDATKVESTFARHYFWFQHSLSKFLILLPYPSTLPTFKQHPQQLSYPLCCPLHVFPTPIACSEQNNHLDKFLAKVLGRWGKSWAGLENRLHFLL